LRVMAVDYGDARTGVAVSDMSGILAGQAWVITERNITKVAETIANEAKTREVKAIVIGYPKNMNGTIGPRAEKSKRLADLLSGNDFEIVLWDERMTTMNAHRILSDSGKYGKKRKQTVDAVAASLILESYLMYTANKKV